MLRHELSRPEGRFLLSSLMLKDAGRNHYSVPGVDQVVSHESGHFADDGYKALIHLPPHLARVGHTLDPSEVRRQVDEGFIPIISEMPGFVAYYLVDAGDGVMVSTSVFEHQEAEEESTWRAGQFVAQREASLLPNPPQITAGELVAHKAS